MTSYAALAATEMKMELRKVIVSKLVPKYIEGSFRTRYVAEPCGEALFHQFGVGYEEFEAGPGNFTTAIVEWPDGRVESVPAEHVQFVTHNTALSGADRATAGNKPTPGSAST